MTESSSGLAHYMAAAKSFGGRARTARPTLTFRRKLKPADRCGNKADRLVLKSEFVTLRICISNSFVTPNTVCNISWEKELYRSTVYFPKVMLWNPKSTTAERAYNMYDVAV